MAIITNLQPPAGTPVGASTAVSFDVIDPEISTLRVFVWAVFATLGQAELIYDGTNFSTRYSFATITPIPGGRRFTVQRVGGWPATPELRVDSCACPPTLIPTSTIAPGWYDLSDYGAVGDGLTDDQGAFTAGFADVVANGGGVLHVPPSAGGFLHTSTLTIPDGVILAGAGPVSRLISRPAAGTPAIAFASGAARGEVRDIAMYGNAGTPQGFGIDYTGGLWVRVRNIQIWDFVVGVRFGDGVTQYAAYNELKSFEINRCATGIQTALHSNSCHIADGRVFWSFDGGGGGIGIDISNSRAVVIDSVDVESADTLIRLRGLVDVSIRGGFWETGAVGRNVHDIDVDPGSRISGKAMAYSALDGVSMQAGLEELIDWDQYDHYPFGAARSPASAAGQNLIENGDLQRANGITSIPQWSFTGGPVAAENTVTYVTAGRSYDITQSTTANDGMSVAGQVPAGAEYVTVCVRFRKLIAGSPFIAVTSGANIAQWDGTHLPVAAGTWRIATVTVEVDPTAAGVFGVTVTADQTQSGGQIGLDEVWAVVGRVAAAPRRHGQRIQLLPVPLELLDRNAIIANETFGPIDLTVAGGAGADGLSQMPEGAVGAIVRLAGRTNVGTAGLLRVDVVTPYLDIPFGTPEAVVRCPITADQVWTTTDITVRDLVLSGGLNFPSASGVSTDYNLHLLGWVLPD